METKSFQFKAEARIETKCFQFKAETVSEDGIFTGYASVFGNKDLGGDIVLPGAFDSWLALWKSGEAATPPVLDNHDPGKVLGVYVELNPDGKGLWAKGALNMETVAGKEKRALMKQGAITGMSIGYSVYPGGYKYDRDKDAWILSDINLWEISLATFPMNTAARVDTVKSAIARGVKPTIRDVERTLRELGFTATMAKAIAKIANERLELCDLDQHRDGAATEEGIYAEELKKLASTIRKTIHV